jgi:cytochrome c-type biogenesis protein
MTDLSVLALLTSFGAGMISFLTPCVLPLVPGYVSYVAEKSINQLASERSARFAALQLGVFFVLGFSTVFIALGASATALGRWLLSYRYEGNFVAGAVVILFGLLMVGLPRPIVFMRDIRFHPNLPGGRPIAAYVLGLAFAFGWTPCIGPILGAILTTSAISATVSQGIVLLAFYSLGLAVPFLLAAVFTDRLLDRLKTLGRIGRSLEIGAGAVVIGMGIAIATGELTTFSYWLLETFPVFAKIG